jgi:thiamine-monophosphate kinase
LEEAARAIDANEKDWVIGGGEDHSLLATFSVDAQLPRAFKAIGVVLPAGASPVMLGAHALPEKGWDSVIGN